jgi:hypothetical protein
MINVEVTVKDGSKHLVEFEGNFEEFKEAVRYDNGFTFFKTKDDYYVLSKYVMYFTKRGL